MISTLHHPHSRYLQNLNLYNYCQKKQHKYSHFEGLLLNNFLKFNLLTFFVKNSLNLCTEGPKNSGLFYFLLSNLLQNLTITSLLSPKNINLKRNHHPCFIILLNLINHLTTDIFILKYLLKLTLDDLNRLYSFNNISTLHLPIQNSKLSFKICQAKLKKKLPKLSK